MTPYAMRCETCGEYIYKGKKFNARKETVEGETYYSIKIFRFYIKCPRCSAEITFKTDPQNTDYVAEHGASRNFEPWREERIAGEESKLQKELEEENNPMKALENRTIDSKREMDILDALDEIRTRNARNERVDADAVLERLVESDRSVEKKEEENLDDEDYQLARSIFHTVDGDTVRRILDDKEPDLSQLLSESAKSMNLPKFTTTSRSASHNSTAEKRKDPCSDLGIVVKRKKLETKPTSVNNNNTLGSLLGNYESSDDSES
ncbi:5760_t:CDS:1 [Acaulospora colombiana]|uniref:5760_t:CDS:1 n=1 Tax=Acaulospora colombiana TaxID=27376 RepID=A0ACA9L0S9_9GLOM|nr:5760_t:CDS:1 [Acaulospora colombiana]